MLRECSPPTTCHMSSVTFHMSHVTCHVLHVTFKEKIQSGEAYRWRVCYQRGLPRLVLINFDKRKTIKTFFLSLPIPLP